MKKNFYLQHSLMAMNDPRMQHMVDEEGLQACGAYWFIIEKLALLPEPRAQLIYLEPYCKSHHISYEYIKKIILNYQLFRLEEDGYFTPVELNPVTKRTPKTEEKPVEKDDFERKTSEIERKNIQKQCKIAQKQWKSVQKEHKIRREKNNNDLSSNVLPKNKSENTKEYIKDIITTAATTEEKEVTAAAAEQSTESSNGNEQLPPASPDSPLAVCHDFDNPQRPLRPIRPWRELADNLLNESSSWLELAYMRSGYGQLLQRHLKQAVEIFKQHIEAYGKGGDMLEMKDIQGYFINYVNNGSRTSKALEGTLKSLDAKERAACPDAVDPYRFEQFINEQRTYQGCPIPADAPPRPDATAFWDDQQHLWITGQKPKS